MIRYQLVCKCKNQFESWFRSSSDFDQQCERGLLACPVCGSGDVSKALMAPNVSTSRGKKTPASSDLSVPASEKTMVDAIRNFREKIINNSEYVGADFSSVARDIHYGDEPERPIHGEATVADVNELTDEGIEVLSIPALPEDKN